MSLTSRSNAPTAVMPAQAGIHPSMCREVAVPIGTIAPYSQPGWIPAFAGMTID